MHNIDISENWELGWCKETRLNKWRQVYGFWNIENGRLKGYGEYPQIYANIEPGDDYLFESVVSIKSTQGELGIMLKRSIQRIAYYDICFKAGACIKVKYIYSAAPETEVLECNGPVLEAEKKYKVGIRVRKSKIEILLDEEIVGDFEDTFPSGSYPGFRVGGNGVGYFENVSIKDLSTDGVIFSDDFKENSLQRTVPVDLSELVVDEWIPADIPGSVQSSLLKMGKIKDPYFGYNGPEQMWVDNQRWIYKKKFTIPPEWENENIKLIFEGIDYHGYFWLNGQLLGYHEGMFGGPMFDITNFVDRKRENELIVCILPCPTPPHSNVGPYILQRWHFNMDILTIGIWRKVNLLAFENITLSEPQVVTCTIEDEKAILNLGVTVTNYAMYPFEVHVKMILQSPCEEDGDIIVESIPGFFQGSMRVNNTIEVPCPRLWWPNGLGPQNLYKVKFIADNYEYTKSTQPTGHAELCIQTGIRLLEMKQSPNPNGIYKWTFSINGRPFFGKGSNWMPLDQMLRLPAEKYDRLLKLACECNINILRPWGAGLIETEEFYDACDKYGICVWQEMPMANGYFNEFDKNVWKDTIIGNVVRLRNRASLVLWCGGNEFDPDCKENKSIVDDLENLCRELDPTRDFHRACPYGGDSHSYQVNWMEGANYTYFTRDLSVAVTEFSMASPPCLDTLKKIMPLEELEKWPPDLADKIDRYDYNKWGENVRRRESAFSMHDAHLSSITNIMLPFMSECGIPKNWDDFIIYMQTAHGMLTQSGIDFWRSRWPYCTLAISWVFNVIWPSSLSWEYVDWFGVPKISYYYKKRAFEQIHVGAVYEELFWLPGSTFRAKLFVANETQNELTGTSVRVRMYSDSLELLKEDEKRLDIPKDEVKHCGFFEYKIPAVCNEKVLFLCADLVDGKGAVLSRSQYSPKIGKPTIKMPYMQNGPWISDVNKFTTILNAVIEDDGIKNSQNDDVIRISIQNTGGRPAYQVSLSAPGFEEYIIYSDNYFWLEADEKRIIEISASSHKPNFIKVKAWNTEAVNLDINN